MKNKRTVLKLAFFAILILTIVTSLVISWSVKRDSKISTGVREVTSPMITLVATPFEAFKNFYDDLSNLWAVQEENEILKAQMYDYFLLKGENDALKQENEQLKELMNLSETITDATPIYATTLYRNAQSFDNFIEIDAGTNDGIAVGQAVVNEKGLIGIVSNVSANTAEVTLLTNSVGNTKVMVEVSEVPGSIGYLSTYDDKEEVFYIEGVDTKYKDKIKPGQTLTTSGYNDIPKGIPIGEVKGWETDPVSQIEYLVVEPYADFNQITTVMVMVK